MTNKNIKDNKEYNGLRLITAKPIIAKHNNQAIVNIIVSVYFIMYPLLKVIYTYLYRNNVPLVKY